MDRRQFIKTALLATTYSLLAGCDTSEEETETISPASATTAPQNTQETNPSMSTTTQTEVLIIGAGSAGLAAARTLADNDYDVIVLEGRERLGGRTWTSQHWPDMPLDMGASWIHGIEDNPIYELAQQLKLQTIVTDVDDIAIYDTDGRSLTDPEMVALDELLEDLIDTIEEEVDLDESMTLQSAIEQVLATRDLSDSQLRNLNYILNTSIEHEYAGAVTELSAKEWDEGEAFGGPDVIFAKGYVQIINHLAQGLDVRLSHTVSQVATTHKGVTVTTDKGVFTANQVIVTVPLGVLQKGKIAFSPPLPRKKQEAIGRLGMGLLNKVYLRFEHAFWTDQEAWLGYIPQEWGHWAEYVNFLPLTNKPILLAFNAAKFGREIETWTDEAIIADVMKVLRTIYGAAVPEPSDWQITRWASDPFAYGSYSFMKAGASPEDRETLAEPVEDVLYFAGEATHVDYPSTVHGAFLSGLRVAEALMEADEA